MQLPSAAFIAALGLALFILGAVRDYKGVATIGAIMVVGVGAIVTTSGLEYQTGVVVMNETANKTVRDFQYGQTSTPRNLPLGGLIMAAGGVLVLRALNDIAEP
jgi:hypothetical protein